jgi:hypothetical protein
VDTGHMQFGRWWMDRFAPARPWAWVYAVFSFGAATLWVVLGNPGLSIAFWLLGGSYTATALVTERRYRRDQGLVRQR